MKIILDHNVPKRLRGALPNHLVTTAKEMGWAELEMAICSVQRREKALN